MGKIKKIKPSLTKQTIQGVVYILHRKCYSPPPPPFIGGVRYRSRYVCTILKTPRKRTGYQFFVYSGLSGGVLADPWNAPMGAAAAASVHSTSPLPTPAFHTSPSRGIPIADPWSNSGTWMI